MGHSIFLTSALAIVLKLVEETNKLGSGWVSGCDHVLCYFDGRGFNTFAAKPGSSGRLPLPRLPPRNFSSRPAGQMAGPGIDPGHQAGCYQGQDQPSALPVGMQKCMGVM